MLLNVNLNGSHLPAHPMPPYMHLLTRGMEKADPLNRTDQPESTQVVLGSIVSVEIECLKLEPNNFNLSVRLR